MNVKKGGRTGEEEREIGMEPKSRGKRGPEKQILCQMRVCGSEDACWSIFLVEQIIFFWLFLLLQMGTEFFIV